MWVRMRNNKEKKQKNSGIAAIAVMLIVLVITVAVTIAIPLFLQKVPVNRINITTKKIHNLKNVIVGNPDILINKVRSSFGFIGDLGVLPASLIDLFEQGAYPSFIKQNNVWFGWRGPYLKDNQNNGAYVATLDAWGNPFFYHDNNGNPIGTLASIAWPVTIASGGEDGIYDRLNPNDDDIDELKIKENEVWTYVQGEFKYKNSRDVITTYDNEDLNIHYPDGTGTIFTTTITTALGVYGTQTPAPGIKIPVGHRYFATADNEYHKIASLNGGSPFNVNFYGDSTTPDAPFFERTFYSTDEPDPDSASYSPINSIIPGATWASDNNGNFWAEGDGEHRAAFGRADWEDYRLEVNATLHQGRGYGIYYRSDGQELISGYCFQYDPGLTSGGRVAFVVRRVYSGEEQAPFQTRIMSLAEFPDVFESSHQISITVTGLRHIIKVDGIERFNFTDNAFTDGMPGLRSWDGNHYTSFHHLLVHEIPPVATGEFVWWSFEEGDGPTVYGSGFLNYAPEINGTLVNMNNIDRLWDTNNIRGKAIYCDGGNNGYVEFGDDFDFEPTDQFSISLWFKMPSINTNREYTLISKISNGNNGRGWFLDVKEVGSNNFAVNFTMRQNGNNNGRRIHVLNNTEILTNRWYHVALTYDGSGITGNTTIPASRVKIYITELSSSVTDPLITSIRATLRASSNTVNNGDFNFGSYRNGSSRFVGYIDEIKVYKNTLTLAEVSDLFDKDQ